MSLTLRQLRIFVAIAEHGSTLAAAAALPLSQSATSNALGELESLLDTPLFDRIGKRLVINETGRALLDPARIALATVADIEQRFTGVAAGQGPVPARIRLGASTTIGNYLMPGRIAALMALQPAAEVELRIGNTRQVVEAVLRLEVDAAVIEGPCHAEELDVRPWREDPMVLVAAPGHALAQAGRQAGPAALRQARWLLREVGSGTREAVDNALLPHLGGFEHALQLGSTEAIKQAAAAGLGIACLSRCAVLEPLALGRLLELPTTLPPLRRLLYQVRHREKRLSPALAWLLEPERA